MIHPHPSFRLFATANTVGQPERPTTARRCSTTRRWIDGTWSRRSTTCRATRIGIVRARVPELADEAGRPLLESMVSLAELTRNGFATGDLSTLMSPRTVINWAENPDLPRSGARVPAHVLNKCDDAGGRSSPSITSAVSARLAVASRAGGGEPGRGGERRSRRRAPRPRASAGCVDGTR